MPVVPMPVPMSKSARLRGAASEKCRGCRHCHNDKAKLASAHDKYPNVSCLPVEPLPGSCRKELLPENW
ncbi:hypothetical protein D3C85_1218250 [compost metagenome]